MSTITLSYLQDRILGSLLAAALGDAMGAGTEQHQIDEIIADHGGLLAELITPPIDTFSYQAGKPGLITDDVSQMMALVNAIIESNGALTVPVWIKHLMHWSTHSPLRHHMGPTTRPLLEAIAKNESTDHIGVVGKSSRKLTSMGATNGSAMRVAPAGLIHPGDVETAVQTAWITCQPTHDTQIAAAGAGAIAAGNAAALLPDADVFSVAKACLAGAELGEEIGRRDGRHIAGPNVHRRIQLAINIALLAPNFEAGLRELEAIVGNSVFMAESVPAAVGIFVLAGGDPLQCAIGGTNIGNDTDTIAAMAASMAGALRGPDVIPAAMRQTLRDANPENFAALADSLAQIAWRHWQ